jgi:hypothetical protein
MGMRGLDQRAAFVGPHPLRVFAQLSLTPLRRAQQSAAAPTCIAELRAVLLVGRGAAAFGGRPGSGSQRLHA